MTLINIKYGSLASSETMNKNFMYLDDKISEVSTSLNTTISSILSNIATINSRLGDLSEDILENAQSCDEKLEKARTLVNKASMVPNWSSCIEVVVSKTDTYEVQSNGFLLLNPTTTASGNLMINNKTVLLKTVSTSSDRASQLCSLPVKSGDEVGCDVDFIKVYFLPAVQFTKEDL